MLGVVGQQCYVCWHGVSDCVITTNFSFFFRTCHKPANNDSKQNSSGSCLEDPTVWNWYYNCSPGNSFAYTCTRFFSELPVSLTGSETSFSLLFFFSSLQRISCLSFLCLIKIEGSELRRPLLRRPWM